VIRGHFGSLPPAPDLTTGRTGDAFPRFRAGNGHANVPHFLDWHVTIGSTFSHLPAFFAQTCINPLKGRDANWLHLAIQV